VKPRSTRADHILGAIIFAGCSVALAWLLATCTTHDAGKTMVAATAITRSVESAGDGAMASHPQDRAKPTQSPIESVMTIAPRTTLTANTTPEATAAGTSTPLSAIPRTTPRNTPRTRHVEHLVPRPPARVSVRQIVPINPTKAHLLTPIARLSKPQVDEHLAPGRATNPAAQSSASKQAEWTDGPSSSTGVAERAALSDWAAQQRHTNITTRASTPAPVHIDWNAQMTQRRITDNPDAFQQKSRAQN
jgi:hypothetical protein